MVKLSQLVCSVVGITQPNQASPLPNGINPYVTHVHVTWGELQKGVTAPLFYSLLYNYCKNKGKRNLDSWTLLVSYSWIFSTWFIGRGFACTLVESTSTSKNIEVLLATWNNRQTNPSGTWFHSSKEVIASHVRMLLA